MPKKERKAKKSYIFILLANVVEQYQPRTDIIASFKTQSDLDYFLKQNPQFDPSSPTYKRDVSVEHKVVKSVMFETK